MGRRDQRSDRHRMVRRTAADQRGVTLLELLVVVGVAGAVILGGLSTFYVATVRAFSDSTSQVALQRVGTVALQAISSRAQLASAMTLDPSPACAPAGTTGRTLLLTLTDTCYYAGNGANGAPAGALCQRFTQAGGTPGTCRNLLAAPQPGLARRTGQAAGVILIRQTSPVSPFCPANTAVTDVNGNTVSAAGAIGTGVYCLDLGHVFPAPGQAGNVMGNVAFGITDGVSAMTFTSSLMRRN
jgi:prepilin-type N-terminal cleavage/methylation domain-containing protein